MKNDVSQTHDHHAVYHRLRRTRFVLSLLALAMGCATVLYQGRTRVDLLVTILFVGVALFVYWLERRQARLVVPPLGENVTSLEKLLGTPVQEIGRGVPLVVAGICVQGFELPERLYPGLLLNGGYFSSLRQMWLFLLIVFSVACVLAGALSLGFGHYRRNVAAVSGWWKSSVLIAAGGVALILVSLAGMSIGAGKLLTLADRIRLGVGLFTVACSAWLRRMESEP